MKYLALALLIELFCFSKVFAIGPYADNGDGTVNDQGTGLHWQQTTADTNNDGSIDSTDQLTWQAALAYCENLNLVDQTDWRLPNIRELTSLVDYVEYYPTVEPIFQSQSFGYWSSTTGYSIYNYAWVVYFDRGYSGRTIKTTLCYVRCARSGLPEIVPPVSETILFPVKGENSKISIISIE